jgi:hypothetical protein
MMELVIHGTIHCGKGLDALANGRESADDARSASITSRRFGSVADTPGLSVDAWFMDNSFMVACRFCLSSGVANRDKEAKAKVARVTEDDRARDWVCEDKA